MEFPNIDPIALELGPIVIRWYGLAYLAGILLGWKYCNYIIGKYFPKKSPTIAEIDDFIIWAVLGVILGGRIGFILFYQLDAYISDPIQILYIWQGGMSFHGGLLGMVVSMYFFARKNKIKFFRLTDVIACCVPIGLFFGRTANFINGELFGRETSVSWGIKFPEGGDIFRHPSQIYEALLEGVLLFLIMFVLIKNKKIRENSGTLTAVFLIGYGVFRAFVELYREPDYYLGLFYDYVSMGQILCIPMILLGISILILKTRCNK